MNFKRFRESANLTQEAVSQLLGVSRTTVTMWESGQSKPRADLLPQIAKLYNCTIDELLKEEPLKEEDDTYGN